MSEIALAKRKIVIATTRGQYSTIETDETTLSPALLQIIKNNYSLSNMSMIENVNKTILQEGSKLPKGDFIIMLKPQKTKSGMDLKSLLKGSFKDLREFSKQVPSVLDYIKSKTTTNYTRLSTEELRSYLVAFAKTKVGIASIADAEKGKGKATPTVKATPVAKKAPVAKKEVPTKKKAPEKKAPVAKVEKAPAVKKETSVKVSAKVSGGKSLASKIVSNVAKSNNVTLNDLESAITNLINVAFQLGQEPTNNFNAVTDLDGFIKKEIKRLS